jgi:hypothetical protein
MRKDIAMNIHRALIPEAIAWRSVEEGGQIGGKEGLAFHFGSNHLAALDALVTRLREFPVEQIKREQFDDPLLNDFFKRISNEISQGRGAAIIQGCGPERYSDQDLARIFWGAGLHLGIALPQTAAGDRIDHIRDLAYNPTGRERPRSQYSREELFLHTDNASGEILGLMSLQRAKSGGCSRVASSLAVHNEIFRNRSDLLEPLYRGFPYHRKGRQPPGEPNVAPFNTPVFCEVEGVVSCRYVRDFMTLAAEEMGVAMPADLVEALDHFDAIKLRDSTGIHFMLERGEMFFLNNLTCLHARTAFEDHEETDRKRHLLRLWLKATPYSRPFDPRMNMFWGSQIDHAAKSERAPAAVGA